MDYLFDLESVRIKVAHTVPVDPPKTEDIKWFKLIDLSRIWGISNAARQRQIVDEEINYLQKDLRLALYKCL